MLWVTWVNGSARRRPWSLRFVAEIILAWLEGLRAAGRLEESIEMYEKAADMDPSNQNARQFVEEMEAELDAMDDDDDEAACCFGLAAAPSVPGNLNANVALPALIGAGAGVAATLPRGLKLNLPPSNVGAGAGFPPNEKAKDPGAVSLLLTPPPLKPNTPPVAPPLVVAPAAAFAASKLKLI